MKLRSPWLTKVAGLLMTAVIRLWMRTLDYKGAFYDPTVDPTDPRCRQNGLYIFWHENILIPLYMRGHCNLAMLMSQHRDADLLSRLALHFGFRFVRGSTRRGGDRALRELVRLAGRSHLTITPDGPRGPRRKLAAGPIYLASKTGMPLVLMGLGYDRPWRAPTWDRFAIPRPFTRARAVLSPAIHLPPDLDRDGIEHYRQRIEALLELMTREAEAWAEAGTAKMDQVAPRRGPAPLGTTLAALEAWWCSGAAASDESSLPSDQDVRRAA
jgi:lysophospholipid acyltransferase (LPLAT)-like uncharacterized protein